MIRTFADCPDREEHWKGENDYGNGDSIETLCPDGGRLSMRIMDYSICRNENHNRHETHACRIGRGSRVDVEVEWCEAALCARVCPRGYVR
jgi:hypothetical protein